MRIESLRVKNFKAFKEIEMKNIPRFCVITGKNGTGKSTLFSIFGFLKEIMNSNVNTALSYWGGARGFRELRSRETEGAVEIEIKFRISPKKPLISYLLKINEEKDQENQAYIEKEVLKYRRGSKGKPWHFIDFEKGKGKAVVNERIINANEIDNEKELEREDQELKSADILAIKGLAQFEKFPAAKTLGNLIENWYVSDFHIQAAQKEQTFSHAEHLSKEGGNLASIIIFFRKKYPERFQKILRIMSERIPGISKVEDKLTEEGRVLLKFKDQSFKEPFLAKYVSDGTIKMMAYLILLYDPKPHTLLCVEEPENQLYPHLLHELADEFRAYAQSGEQVFVSTHSPDFLNAVHLVMPSEKKLTIA